MDDMESWRKKALDNDTKMNGENNQRMQSLQQNISKPPTLQTNTANTTQSAQPVSVTSTIGGEYPRPQSTTVNIEYNENQNHVRSNDHWIFVGNSKFKQPDVLIVGNSNVRKKKPNIVSPMS